VTEILFARRDDVDASAAIAATQAAQQAAANAAVSEQNSQTSADNSEANADAAALSEANAAISETNSEAAALAADGSADDAAASAALAAAAAATLNTGAVNLQGGTLGQTLVKLSAANYDFGWAAAAAVGVTSVGLVMPTGFTVTNSPVTSTGDLTVAFSAGYRVYTDTEATKLSGIAPNAQIGTVTSVAITQPAAGITFTGGPITGGGTFTVALADDLAALENLATVGIVVRTTTNTFATRSLGAPAAGITFTNPAGIAGNINLVLANGLASIEALATTGIVRQTVADTFTAGTLIAANEIAAGVIRERLTANRTYYVLTTGSDSNTGLVNNAGGAFLTLVKAMSVVQQLDIGIYNVTIQVGNGTYAGFGINGPWLGSGDVTLTGNTGSPGSVIFNSACEVFSGAVLAIEGCRFTNAGGNGVAVEAGGIVYLGNVQYGACSNFQLYCGPGGQAFYYGNVGIVGGASMHCTMVGGSVDWGSGTWTLTGTPAFSYFAYASRLGSIICDNATISGAATGTRYNADTNSIIFTGGKGATFLPGNVAGGVSTGGQYL